MLAYPSCWLSVHTDLQYTVGWSRQASCCKCRPARVVTTGSALCKPKMQRAWPPVHWMQASAWQRLPTSASACTCAAALLTPATAEQVRNVPQNANAM